MLGAGWASGDEANANGDERNAGPPLQADVLMQPEAGEQRHDHITEGGGGKDVGKIGKRKRSHVAGHEAEQAEDSNDDPGIGKGEENVREMVNVDGSDILHAARQERISAGAEDHDS